MRCRRRRRRPNFCNDIASGGDDWYYSRERDGQISRLCQIYNNVINYYTLDAYHTCDEQCLSVNCSSVLHYSLYTCIDTPTALGRRYGRCDILKPLYRALSSAGFTILSALVIKKKRCEIIQSIVISSNCIFQNFPFTVFVFRMAAYNSTVQLGVDKYARRVIDHLPLLVLRDIVPILLWFPNK